MKKDYSKSADTLVQAMGGKDNITRVFHCMTRLRFYVKDKNKIDEARIKKLPEISGVNWHQDQFQVIAGNYLKLILMPVYSGNFREFFDACLVDLILVFYIESESCHAVEDTGDIVFAAHCLNQRIR